MNIVLAGMPGCGKTTTARAYSAIYGAEVIDLDSEIVKEHGPINSIFEKSGEDVFRGFERDAVEKACRSDGKVISVGGGCVLFEANVRALRQNGKIVYLRTGLDTLVGRVEGNGDRPLLKDNFRAAMKELFEKRTPVYESVADIIIDTDGLSAEEVARQINIKLNKHIN